MLTPTVEILKSLYQTNQFKRTVIIPQDKMSKLFWFQHPFNYMICLVEKVVSEWMAIAHPVKKKPIETNVSTKWIQAT